MAKVFANGRSIIHRGDKQTHIAGPPDVCKTPSPGEPVPVPYVNAARSSDLVDGSKTVKIRGHSIALRGSSLSTSSGNEAGAAGGGIISGKVKGKMVFTTGSPDVYIEGKPVARFMDVTMHNGNSFNTSFIAQGSTGLAYVDDGDGPCPICAKSYEKHRILETPNSATLAADLIDALRKRVEANPDFYHRAGFMVGVLICECGQQYTAMSGAAIEEFIQAAQTVGFADTHIFKGKRVTSAELASCNSRIDPADPSNAAMNDKFMAAWKKSREENQRDQRRTPRLGYQAPGTCAAPKLLYLSKGHKPRSMTEMFFLAPDKKWDAAYLLGVNGVRQTVRYTSGEGAVSATTSDGAKIQAAYSELNRNERSDLTSVGSCRTCQNILPLICCDLEDRAC